MAATDVVPLAFLHPAVLPDTPGDPTQNPYGEASTSSALYMEGIPYSPCFTAFFQVKEKNRDLLERTGGHEAYLFSAAELGSSTSSSVSLIIKLRTYSPTKGLRN